VHPGGFPDSEGPCLLEVGGGDRGECDVVVVDDRSGSASRVSRTRRSAGGWPRARDECAACAGRWPARCVPATRRRCRPRGRRPGCSLRRARWPRRRRCVRVAPAPARRPPSRARPPTAYHIGSRCQPPERGPGQHDHLQRARITGTDLPRWRTPPSALPRLCGGARDRRDTVWSPAGSPTRDRPRPPSDPR
jgi:hypothetical protein